MDTAEIIAFMQNFEFRKVLLENLQQLFLFMITVSGSVITKLLLIGKNELSIEMQGSAGLDSVSADFIFWQYVLVDKSCGVVADLVSKKIGIKSSIQKNIDTDNRKKRSGQQGRKMQLFGKKQFQENDKTQSGHSRNIFGNVFKWPDHEGYYRQP